MTGIVRWMRRAFGASLALLLAVFIAGCASRAGAPAETPPPAVTAAPAAPAAPAAEPASIEPQSPLPSDPVVLRGWLDNGLTYYIRPNRKPEKRAELRLVVRAGSILEDDDQLGLAHFLEHMAFNGTRNFEKKELVDYLESVGMRFGPDLNAYTSFDETVYMLQIPTDVPEVIDQALLILADWAGAVSLEAEEIDKERGVVIEEWRLGRGAGARVRDQQFPVLFQDSRYAQRLPIGEKAILESFEHETLRRFYRDWYRPNLMAVIAVGDFDADTLRPLIESRFAPLRNPDPERERFEAEVPDHDETLVSVVTDPELTTTAAAVNYKYDVPPETTTEDYRKSLVEGVFNTLLSDRLAERAQEAEPPFLGASSSEGRFNRTKGIYALEAAVAPGGMLPGLDALLTEAERARRHGFVVGELERAKSDLLRGYERLYLERDKVESDNFAAEYVRNFVEDEPYPGIEVEVRIAQRYVPAIELDEVDAMARRFLTDRNRVILATAPKDDSVLVPSGEALLAVFDQVKARELEPWVDRVTDRPLLAEIPEGSEVVARSEIPELGITKWQLRSGVLVVLKPTDFKNDQILFNSFSPGGHSLVDDPEHVAALTATGVVELSGLGEFGVVELEKRLAGKAVQVTPYIDELTEGITGGGSPDDLETLFQLVYLTATAPRCDTDAFRSFQTRMRGYLRNQLKQPEVVYRHELQRVLTGNHFRRRPMDEALLDEMNLDASCSIYKERFRDFSDFTFVLVGALEPDQLEPLVERYLGGLPAAGRQEQWRDVGVKRPEGVIERAVHLGLEPKSRVSLVFTGPFEQSAQNRFDLEAMRQLLQTRLREKLREDKGGTYGVSVGANTSFDPRQEYSLSIAFACDPEKTEELVQSAFEDIEGIKSKPATELELTKIKEQQRRERETALRTNGFWLGALQFYYRNGLDPREILTFDQRVDSLSAEVILRAAERYLNRENYVEFVLLPEEKEPPA